MFYLTRSIYYSLDYEFCQTDTGIVGPNGQAMDQAVKDVHGICTVLGMDWLKAKFADTSFVVSFQSVWEKARQYQNNQRLFSQVYSDYAPNLRQGNVTEYAINEANCTAIANALNDGCGAALHVGEADDRTLGENSHLLAVFRNGDTYYMFDSNFGSYHAGSARGCAAWIWAICRENRPNRGRYTDWANALVYIPYS